METTETSESKFLALGMVLLDEQIAKEEVLGRLAAAGFSPEFTTGENGGSMVELSVGEVSVFLDPLPFSLPGDEVLENIHPVFTEDSEMQRIGMHRAHLLLAAVDFDGSADVLAVHRAHARVLREVSSWEEVAGYSLAGTTMGPTALRRELGEEADPVAVWAPAWVWEGDDGVTGYTFGLTRFGLPELQIVGAPVPAPEAYLMLIDASRHLIEGGTLESLEGESATWVVDPSREAWQLRR